MHALVTGAAGFLGRYIVEQLRARGDAVTALVRDRRHSLRESSATVAVRKATIFEQLQSLGATLAFGDLTDPAAVANACTDVDVVFHVAARAGLGGPWQQYFEPNVIGTRNVLTACKLRGVPRLVFTSSPSVTFAGVDQQNVDEAAPYPARWLAHYPHSKAIAEQEVLGANSPTLATCSLRPHLIWGPRDAHLIPKLIARAKAGRLRRVGSGENLIDMIYVENAAAAHLQAAERLSPDSPVAGQAYFLSHGEPVNCWQWIDELLALAGEPAVRKSISYGAAYRLGSICEGVWKLLGRTDDPPMTRFLAAQLATHHYFDISKAKRDFAYAPRIDKEEGMRRLAAELHGPMR